MGLKHTVRFSPGFRVDLRGTTPEDGIMHSPLAKAGRSYPGKCPPDDGIETRLSSPSLGINHPQVMGKPVIQV